MTPFCTVASWPQSTLLARAYSLAGRKRFSTASGSGSGGRGNDRVIGIERSDVAQQRRVGGDEARADADDVVAALLASGTEKSEPPQNPMSADRVRWEHIQRIYEMCNRNVSETARRLNMHRRTLQRILAKRAPR